MFKKQILFNIIVLFIGLTFAFSAMLKLVNISQFSNTIYNYGIPYINYLAPIIVIFELILGLHLLFFVNVKRFLLISLITILFFTIFYAYGYFFKDVQECGCFGNFLTNFFDKPIVLFGKNIFLIILNLIAIKLFVPKLDKDKKLKTIVIYVIVSFGMSFLGYSFNKSVDEVYDENFEAQFLNKSVGEVGIDKFYHFSSDSTYIAFIFSYTCPHCLNTVANVNLYKQFGYVNNIIYLPVGGGQAKLDFDKNYKIIGPKIDGASPAISRISGTYPTILFIKNNNIIFVNEGFISAPIVFFRTNNIDLTKN